MSKPVMYTTKAGERRFQIAAPVSEELYEELRRLAFEQRTTISAQVRQAVLEYLNRDQNRHAPIPLRVELAGRPVTSAE